MTALRHSRAQVRHQAARHLARRLRYCNRVRPDDPEAAARLARRYRDDREPYSYAHGEPRVQERRMVAREAEEVAEL